MVMAGSIDPASAQTNEQFQPDSSLHWINIGLGPGTGGMAAGAVISIKQNSTNKYLSFRITYNEEFVLFTSPSENVWDVGALIGIRNRSAKGLSSISAGLSVVGGRKRSGNRTGGDWFGSEYDSRIFTTMGIPVNTELFLTPSKNFGIGLNGFANINPQKPFAGVLLCLQIGKIH